MYSFLFRNNSPIPRMKSSSKKRNRYSARRTKVKKQIRVYRNGILSSFFSHRNRYKKKNKSITRGMNSERKPSPPTGYTRAREMIRWNSDKTRKREKSWKYYDYLVISYYSVFMIKYYIPELDRILRVKIGCFLREHVYIVVVA